MTAPVPVATSELGHASSGTGWWGGLSEETTPELRWPNSVQVFDQMRKQDSQVKSVLRAVTLPVLRTTWRLDPAGARDEVVELLAQDLRLPIAGTSDPLPGRSRDRFSWPEHLRMALLSLPMGHMFFEQSYRLDDAGRVRLRKLAPRMPRSISQVNVAPDGGLISIEQHPPTSSWSTSTLVPFGGGRPIVIPVSRLVAYAHEREASNWLGESILRSAYKNWLIKDRLLRVQAQTIERNGMGVPVYEAGPKETSLDEGEKLARNFRSGDSAGAAIANGANLRLSGVDGTLPDADPAIRYHDEQIARAVLAHFLNLGTQTGSWALGTTFADFFTLSLQTVAEYLADVANQHIVEDLVDLNFGPDEPAPRLVFDEIGSRHAATAQAIKMLIDARAIVADGPLEEHLRQTYGLPAAEPGAAIPPEAAA